MTLQQQARFLTDLANDFDRDKMPLNAKIVREAAISLELVESLTAKCRSALAELNDCQVFNFHHPKIEAASERLRDALALAATTTQNKPGCNRTLGENRS